METVVHDTKMMDSKFTLEIQRIKDALKEERASHQAGGKNNLNVDIGKWCCGSSKVFVVVIIIA